MVDLNELVRKKDLFIDNAATASQNETLIDDGVTREAIELNIITPLIVEISERDQRIAALEAQLAERGKANRETVAKHVYDAMSWAAVLGPDPATGTVPQWVDGGNSLGQDEARKTADAILSALEATPPAPKVTEDADMDDAAVAALVALARHNIPTDIQELLVRGDPMRSIPPGALSKSFAAALKTLTAAQEAGKP